MKKVGIYIHFPFCASKCKYCNFVSFSGKNDMQLKYFQSLIKEISAFNAKDIQVDTVFIGGGTPSIMFDGCISTLLSEIRKNFKVLENAEITIEANPNSINISKAQEWKESGVNRVSVGLQTTNLNSLKLIGRPHTKQDYIRAIDDIKSVGITNINTDCLIGLPRQKQSDVRKTLGLVMKMGCSHISVYSLILEENTSLYDMVDRGEIKLPKEEKVLGMYNYANKVLSEFGYNRYEVSNFAKENYECRHNLNTWKMGEYLGFGVGAHSYFNSKRYSNVSSIEEYIKLISLGKRPIEDEEKITPQETFEETIMLGLRTKYGINLNEIKNKFNIDLLKLKHKEIDFFTKENMISINNENLIVTSQGMPVLNKIILELVANIEI
ncbi:MAG: radical SAM family heme chaperone HemW [Christensenellales bacterium]